MQNVRTAPPALALLQSSAAAREGMLVLLFGALTAVSAQVEIPVQPVPVTLQVFTVLLAGALLGPRLGLLSQLAYLTIGILGAPVFAGGKSGLLALAGPTAGYLVAFPLAAWAAGVLGARCRRFPALAAGLVALAAGILLLGGAWLAAWGVLTGAGGAADPVAFGWTAGVAPFLPLDTLKALAAAAAVYPLVRRPDA